MRLRIDQNEERFRSEVRSFVRDNLPDDIRRRVLQRRPLDRGMWERWQRALNARGWAFPSWPVEHGGAGWSASERYMFHDELQKAPAPEPHPLNGMIGPILIAFGTPQQKDRFLPRLANLDDYWCQGFSEPNAGSDLADIRTSARLDRGCYVVNGQKTWISSAHEADWMFCLVRTSQEGARKQDGISMLLIDLRSAGVSIRPIPLIDGSHEVNEVFLENVRVPVENRLGEENKGWKYARHLLAHERTGIARVGVSLERLRQLKEGSEPLTQAGSLVETPAFRRKLAELEIELHALEMTQRRATAPEHFGSSRDGIASILKLKGSELHQRAVELLAEAAGPFALSSLSGDGTSAYMPPWCQPLMPGYLFSRSYTIYGGSTQIQKNILARQVLGLQ